MLTDKAFLGGSAQVSRVTNGVKTHALFKKAEKGAKNTAQKAQSKVTKLPLCADTKLALISSKTCGHTALI